MALTIIVLTTFLGALADGHWFIGFIIGCILVVLSNHFSYDNEE